LLLFYSQTYKPEIKPLVFQSTYILPLESLPGSLELFLSVLLDITYTRAVVKAATTRKQIKNGHI